MTCDFQQFGILTSLDSDEPVQKLQMLFGHKLNIHRIFKRLAKTLIRLRVCADWSEPLLIAHTTLLEISCRGSIFSLYFMQLQEKGLCGKRIKWNTKPYSVPTVLEKIPVPMIMSVMFEPIRTLLRQF